MVSVQESRKKGLAEEQQRRAGLVIRVSTDRQAMTEEGSLKNQMQRLRQHIVYKRDACGEDWQEVATYELKAVSGKNSFRSPELQRLFADIRLGRVNTVVCTALDRICRSVKDFLQFFEILNDHGVEFVCLKQNYDTTTSQGKLFITIMMALAEFEREQTSERTRDATAARSDRGLWNGGRLLGYDLSDNKGHLVPNQDEVALINFAFDTYLACGSLKQTGEALNRRGYRTKSYSSRRGKEHPGVEFGTTSVQYLLKNPAYVGKKEINKKKLATGDTNGYRLVDAVWPPIVDEEKFLQVREFMAANAHSNHNGSRPIRHAYVLGGLLRCGRCGSPMESRSGTGRLKTTYYYYICRNKDCGLRVSAHEIEGLVLDRIRELASNEKLCQRLVEDANKRLQKELPQLTERRRTLARNLDEVKAQADKAITVATAMSENEGRSFLKEKLADLARRRTDLEKGIEEVDGAIAQAKRDQVKVETVQSALAKIGDLFGCLKPFEQKELMRLVVRSAEVSDRQIVLELYRTEYLQDENAPEIREAQSDLRFERTNWLPEQVSSQHYYR